MSRRLTAPLGRKIVAAILGTTLLALLLFFGLNLVPTMYGFRDNAAHRARAQAELMAASLVAAVDFDDPAAAGENLATLLLDPNVVGAAVYIGGKTPFAACGTPPLPLPDTGEQMQMAWNSLRVSCPIPAQQPGATLVMAASLAGQWGVMRGYLLVGAGVLVLVFLFSFKIAGMFRRKLINPLGDLTGVVRDISRDKAYSRRVAYAGDDEIGVLVSEFNAMLEKIESRDAALTRHQEQLEETVAERTAQLRAKQKELLGNNRLLLDEIRKRTRAEMIREEVERINRHDLKSSLSLVIGYPEILLSEGGLTPDQEKKVKRIRAAGYRMLDMIRNHLDMFKMENGIYALKASRVDLVAIVCDLEEEFSPLLARSGVVFGVELDDREVVGDEAFVVVGEGPLMRTMLRNLIQNAIEASRPGDRIAVKFKSGEQSSVTVTNPATVPNDVKRRFFDKYVTRGKENGTGLGTYIVSLIARTHGANVTMKSDKTSGTAVTVFFREAAVDRGKTAPEE